MKQWLLETHPAIFHGDITKYSVTENGIIMAICGTNEAGAKFIVHAVNNHHQLLAALKNQIVRAGESIASGAAIVHATHTKECLAGRYWESDLCTQHCQPVVAAIEKAEEKS